MRVEISLGPETLEPVPDRAPSVHYYPTGRSVDGYYALTNGRFEVETTSKIDTNSFRLIAIAKGEMTRQEGNEPVHNRKDILEFNARFELQRVVNRGDRPLP